MSDFVLSKEQLGQLLPNNPYIEEWYAALTQVLPDYDINTPRRIAAFVAQCAHESGNFRVLKENLNYKAASLMRVWPRYFPSMEVANQYAHNQEAIANRAYANRMGNGDEASGDGWRYCGRGLLQITGRDNYQAFADSVEMPVEEAPAFLATFEGAAQGAAWFWEANNLNVYADQDDITTMTKRINGGTLGLHERIDNYATACRILNA